MVSCAECGFRGATMSTADLVREAARFAPRYTAVLTPWTGSADLVAVLRTRPRPTTWSALEYAAHVRDALGFYGDRIRRVAAQDRPRLAAFGFDAACEERRYNEQEPGGVLRDLAAAADGLAGLLEGLPPDGWRREGIGSGGDPRTIRTLAERAVHEGRHHLVDVDRSLRAARARR